jgi:hypothetical protein
MTSLSDKAAESPDVELIRDAQYSAWRLADDELVAADELTDEGEFPKYGDYLPVYVSDDDDAEPLYIECPQGLASALLEAGIEVGEWFRIGEARKVDGAWQVDVTEGAERADSEKS